MNQRPLKLRRGYLLTEMVVVISVSSTLAVVAVAMLASLLGVERTGRKHLETTNSLVRLSKQFRRDVATAESAVVVDSSAAQGSELQLRLSADRRVVYRAEPGQIVRLEDDVQAPPGRERFDLPAASQARFAIEAEPARLIVLLTLGQSSSGGSPGHGSPTVSETKRRRMALRDGMTRNGWSVEALVGRDLRYGNRRHDAAPASGEVTP
jgi:type II secretory pathway pseudopilin PulG